MYAEVVDGAIELNATYRDKDLVRAIPGSRFSSPPPTWTVPLTWTSCLQLRGTFGRHLEIGPGLTAWARAESERISHVNRLRELVDGPELPLPPPDGLALLPFQRADVMWMLEAESGILMQPTGAGKTVVTLTWARQNGYDRVLVVCPAGKKIDWVDECRLWYPELPADHATGSAKERSARIREAGDYGGLVSVTMESLRTHSRLAPYGQVRLSEAEKVEKVANEYEWDAIVVDEAHRMADPRSKQTRACWAVARHSKHRWALTATPTTKGIDTLWSSLHFADAEEHPSRSKYVDRYATTETNFWGGVTVGAVRPEMEREFVEVIRPRTRHLPKDVVLASLPPMIPVLRKVPMTAQQAAAYKQMADRCLAEVASGEVMTATSAAAQWTRLGQLACSWARTEERPPDARHEEAWQAVELEEPSSKIDALLEDLNDWNAQGESVAVFATSKRLLKLTSTVLGRRKLDHSVVWGGQKEVERYEEVERFQKGETKVILVVIKAGGTGLNLTRARIGAFMQRSWARWEDLQAEGRFLRIGSERHESVLRVDYVAPDTVEVGQLDVLAAKDDVLQQVLRDRELFEKMVRGSSVTGRKFEHHRLADVWAAAQ